MHQECRDTIVLRIVGNVGAWYEMPCRTCAPILFPSRHRSPTRTGVCLQAFRTWADLVIVETEVLQEAESVTMQVLLSVPKPVCVTFMRAALQGPLQKQRYQDGKGSLISQIAMFPRKLLPWAVIACVPSINSRLTWSMRMALQELPRWQRIAPSALSHITELTSISFSLYKPPQIAYPADGILDEKELSAIQNIAQSICKLPNLSHLSISSQGLSCDTIGRFAKALPAAEELEHLRIECDGLQANTCTALSDSLRQLTRLTALVLTFHLEVSAEVQERLGHMYGLMHNLRSLAISQTCAGAAACVPLLDRNLPALRQLVALSLRMHLTSLWRKPNASLCRAIGRLTQLCSLSIHTNVPIPHFGLHLRQHCAGLTQLWHLSLCGVLRESCAQPLGALLRRLNVHELEVRGAAEQRAVGAQPAAPQRLCTLPARAYATLPEMSGLVGLDLSDCSLEVARAGGALAAGFPNMRALRWFKWVTLPAEPSVDVELAGQVAAALAQVPFLREVHLSGEELVREFTPRVPEVLDLQKVVLFGRVPWVLDPKAPGCCSFSCLDRLTDIRLIGNMCLPGVVPHIAAALAEMPRLQVLILSYQKLDYVGAAKLARALWPQKHVCGGVQGTVKAASGLRKLYLLGLGGCGLDKCGFRALSPALHGLAGCALKQVMLWGNEDVDAAVALSASLLAINPGLIIDGSAPGLQ